MLTIHHLERSQSERIVWLCEELGIPYELVRYQRDPVTILAPPALRALHPIGSAPVIVDDDLVLAESAAIIEYLFARHGAGTLAVGPDQPNFADYLYWFHFANGTLQPTVSRVSLLHRMGQPADNPFVATQRARLDRVLGLVETRLGATSHLAGDEFTVADIMNVFSLTTMRHFTPLDLSAYPNIQAYLARIAERPAYRRAKEQADPGIAPPP